MSWTKETRKHLETQYVCYLHSSGAYLERCSKKSKTFLVRDWEGRSVYIKAETISEAKNKATQHLRSVIAANADQLLELQKTLEWVR